MRSLPIILLLLLQAGLAGAQADNFPAGWTGHWKGELQWFRQGKTDPQKVNMELHIQPGDSIDTYTWQIIYGSAAEDNRPYILKPVSTSAGHWRIDERNGIVLDQFWVGNRFCGAFTVQGNTILNSYQKTGDQLVVEFYSLPAKPLVTTGNGTDESPKVDSYRISGFQRAVLTKVN